MRPSVRARLSVGSVVAVLAALGPPAAASVLLTPDLPPAVGPAAAPGAAAAATVPALVEPAVVLVQRTERQVTLRALRDRSSRLSAKGSDLWRISALGSFDVPAAALRAYKHAAATMARTQPACRLPWTLLAGIGRVESDHGRYGGSVLGSDGVPRPAIRGIALNGVGPVAAIHDTDHGRFDGDKVWDRAVGPMQFIPSTWAYAGRDGDGDGTATPNDLDDAALAAADYLCPSSGSILAPGAMRRAILSYNHSDYYVTLVTAFARGYRTGSFSIPSPPPPAAVPASGAGDHHGRAGAKGTGRGGRSGARHGAHHGPRHGPGHGSGHGSGHAQPGHSGGGGHGGGNGGGGNGGGGTGGGGNGGGTPPTTPPPAPTPTPPPPPPPAPTFSVRHGALSACSGGWCLDGARLDLGNPEKLSRQAAGDLDGDGTVESNREELTGLEGTSVQVKVQDDTSPLLVVELQNRAY